MKKKRGLIITIVIIIAIIITSIIILTKSNSKVSEETAKCIGQNSQLYAQLGCHACENQEKMFGKNYKHLNVTDCWFERDKCLEVQISATPTWIIQGEKYIGVQNIERLKELTGC